MSKRAFLKKSTRLFLAAIGFLILTLIFSQGSYSANVRGVTEDTITIRSICDMTGPTSAIIGGLGLTAPITYSSTSHKPKEYTRVYKADAQKGVLMPVTDWRKPSF